MLACVAGCLLAGCGGESDTPLAEVTAWSLSPVTVVQPDEAPFGRVADLELGPDGSVFVLDGLSRTIRVFDPAGAEVREFGGRGEGPGEFEQPGLLMWGPEGHLWVLDLQNGRMTAFDTEGELRSTHQPRDLPIVFPFAVSFSGPNRVQWVGISSPDPANPAAAWVETELADGVFAPLDQAVLPFVEWPLLFEHRDDDMAMVLPVPFSGAPLFGFDPQGRLWYNFSGEADLHRWSRSGGIERTLTTDIAPTPVSDADRDEALAREELAEVRDGLGAAGLAEMAALIPANKPYYGSFFFDDTGSLWVMHAEGGGPDAEGRTVDIYDPDGTARATANTALVPSPRPRARGDLVAGVVRDALGVESIGVFRVVR
jgi:hypothetical protein